MSGSAKSKDSKERLDEHVPEWGQQKFVSRSNSFMKLAIERIEKIEKEYPEVSNPTAAAIVKDGKLLTLKNGGQVHKSFCPRIALQSPSGQEYELCPNHCHFANHAEANATRQIKEENINAKGAELYLAGHYWACSPCWQAMRSVGITKLNLLENAKELYKKKRDLNQQGGGKLSQPLYAEFFPKNPHQIEKIFNRVNIFSAKQNQKIDFIILLPGALENQSKTSTKVFDYHHINDFKTAITQLSVDLEEILP